MTPISFTHPLWLIALAPGTAWILWTSRKSDLSLSPFKRWAALITRLVLTLLLVGALAGVQRREAVDGMNVFFLLDRSDSIPSSQQESSLQFVNECVKGKDLKDRAGVLVFGADAALENTASSALDLRRVNAVIAPERTDISGAIRLATAAFPEEGQKRMVLVSDGNENMGDAVSALLSARGLGITVDVLPRGVERKGDAAIERVALPGRLKKGQVFEPKVFIESGQDQKGVLRIFRNDQLLGEQPVELKEGKNVFSFSQQLSESGFYRYDTQLEVPGDTLPQNNRGTAFTGVRGEPRILLISSAPSQDASLASALRAAKLEVKVIEPTAFPADLAELQSYDSVFLSNIAAGDIPRNTLRLLDALVKDFGVGLVCLGGDQSFTAGGYRGTPLETLLPVGMELDSRKVLPKGAVVLVMHGMEFNNGNQVARDCALGVLEALGPQDEMGVVLWDGIVRWLFPLAPVGDKSDAGRSIAGMNQGDLPSFQEVMSKAYDSLKKSTANLKHIIVFSDGDPGPPSTELMTSLKEARITVSTVLIAGHAGPDTMAWIATQGEGRFFDVKRADQLPQIFLKEAAVILKSAIFEEPFRPKLAAMSELSRGIPASEYPTLRGYVATSPKPRAETPLISDKGDPILAHWQYGLGRTVAFTSDAKARWAGDWLAWPRYQQFWSQVAQWSLRRLESTDFNSEVAINKGEGLITVEPLDERGNYRNFANLQAVVIDPKGARTTVRLEQTGPGRYQAAFPTRDVGAYVVNVMEMKGGKVASSQVIGSSVAFSPEFSTQNSNLPFLHRLAELGGGQVLSLANPIHNPFLLNRRATFQSHDLWSWLLRIAILLFTLDVAMRRIALEPGQVRQGLGSVQRMVFFWRAAKPRASTEPSLANLLARRDAVRSKQTPAGGEPAVVVDPRLFEPAVEPPQSALTPSPGTGTADASPATIEPAPPPPASAQESTASRLLAAKRKAVKRPPNPG
ncbi:MAG: VWA domain-containing protein [Verrucomicrobia bacterium]|nr:VWA domain-containing protein [Verrucomicrobiota bacterium]